MLLAGFSGNFPDLFRRLAIVLCHHKCSTVYLKRAASYALSSHFADHALSTFANHVQIRYAMHFLFHIIFHACLPLGDLGALFCLLCIGLSFGCSCLWSRFCLSLRLCLCLCLGQRQRLVLALAFSSWLLSLASFAGLKDFGPWFKSAIFVWAMKNERWNLLNFNPRSRLFNRHSISLQLSRFRLFSKFLQSIFKNEQYVSAWSCFMCSQKGCLQVRHHENTGTHTPQKK